MDLEPTQYTGIYWKHNKKGDTKLYVHVTGKCPKTGKMLHRRKTLKATATLDDALVVRSQLRAAIGEDDEPEHVRTTLASYAKTWMDRKRSRLSPKTATTYTTAIEQHILPHLGDLYVDAIIRADVEDWVVWAEQARQTNGNPYAQATLRSWWRPLKQMLQDAAADVGIMDPTARIRPPTVHRPAVRETKTLSAKQLGKFLEAFQRLYPQFYVCVLTLAYTGMRLDEAMTLPIAGLDYENECLEVIDAKNHAIRVAYMPTALAEALQEHIAQMVKDQHPGLASGLVFPADNGNKRFGSVVYHPMVEVSDHLDLGVHVTPQVLRRTYNTLLLEAGVDKIVIRAQMGHSDDSQTERYAGVGVSAKKAGFERGIQLA